MNSHELSHVLFLSLLEQIQLGILGGISHPARTGYCSPFSGSDSAGKDARLSGPRDKNIWVSSTSSVLLAAQKLHPACCLEELLRRWRALAPKQQSASQTLTAELLGSGKTGVCVHVQKENA